MLLLILAHHQEAADADLLDKIKHQLDAIFGLGPVTFVVILGLIILAIPLGILLLYAIQRRRGKA